MGNTKNHRRNKNKQTKKCKRVGGGLTEDVADAAVAFDTADKNGDGNGTLDEGEYNQAKLSNMLDFKTVGGVDKVVDKNEFIAAYLFAKADTDNSGTLEEGEYNRVKLSNMLDFKTVAGVDKKVDFDEFLQAYKSTTGGRRRRKRSTRNKRKTNKKRRTVKRRKSAKRSHRRK